MRMEDLNYYKMNEKICLGANNYLKSAAAQDVLNSSASALIDPSQPGPNTAAALLDPSAAPATQNATTSQQYKLQMLRSILTHQKRENRTKIRQAPLPNPKKQFNDLIQHQKQSQNQQIAGQYSLGPGKGYITDKTLVKKTYKGGIG